MAVRVGRVFQDLFAKDKVTETVDATKAMFELADKLQKPEVQKLAPLVQQGGSLLDILNSPLGEFVESTVPFVKVATGLLRFYISALDRPPTLPEEVTLVSQAAYLESFAALVSKPTKFQTWLKQQGNKPAPELVKQQFKRLNQVEVDDRTARLTLLYFHESPLAQSFNEVLVARLEGLGLAAETTHSIVDRVARATNALMLTALVDLGESAQRLVQWYQMGGQEVFEKYFSQQFSVWKFSWYLVGYLALDLPA